MLHTLKQFILPAAYDLLPPRMDSPEASALLLAIALQESQCRYRRQMPGPARGFWQFEAAGGTKGVLTHRLTKTLAKASLGALCYSSTLDYKAVHALLEHNDVVACVFARLLIFTLPNELPAREDVEGAWSQYLAAWRPGKPHQATWPENHRRAWAAVEDDNDT